MALSSSSLKNISHYYHYVCNIAYHNEKNPEYKNQQNEKIENDEHLSFLFEPTHIVEDTPHQPHSAHADSHRLLLTILDGTTHDIDELLDATEEIISQNMLSGPEFIFV
ncbi:MAG: hypothetical protein AAF639_20510, partial [Chloroflexota bacterium]